MIWFELNWFTKRSGSWRLSRKEWMTFCIFHSKEKMRDELVTSSSCDWSVVTVSSLVLVGCDDEIALNKDTGIKPMSNVLFYWVSWAVHSRDHQTLTHTTLQHASSQVPSHKLTLLWNWKTDIRTGKKKDRHRTHSILSENQNKNWFLIF